MKLIRQLSESVSYSTKGYGSEKEVYIEGIFLQGEIVNKNGRKYPESVLDSAVQEYIKEKVSRNISYGELNHPKDGSPEINLEKVSHLIIDLSKKGTNWEGKARLFDTETGKIAKAIVLGGGRLAVSSRALGNIVRKDNVDVVESLQICTAADIVAEPSAPDAYVDVVMENYEWIFDERKSKYICYEVSEVNNLRYEAVKNIIEELKTNPMEILKLIEI